MSGTAVFLENPKFSRNVGGAIRACAAFGAQAMVWSGDRVTTEGHLPRELRYRNYRKDVAFWRDPVNSDKIIRALCRAHELIPVAVEVRNSSETLVLFEHPKYALYVFGPEDGSLSKTALSACHRFVHVPSHYALNLAATVNVVLYDRRAKRQLAGIDPIQSLDEVLVR